MEKEREEESERKRLVEERQRRLEVGRKETEHKQEEGMLRESMTDSIRAQQRIQLETEYRKQRERVLELKAPMSIAADKPNYVSDRGLASFIAKRMKNLESLRGSYIHGRRVKNLLRWRYTRSKNNLILYY
jgi:hypothetical protein